MVERSALRLGLAGPQPPAAPRALSPLVQYALLAGPLLSMLDSSIVNVAVEPIARVLHAGLTTDLIMDVTEMARDENYRRSS